MKADKVLVCDDCKQEFPFTVGEQQFYESKNLPEPKYCMICRGKYGAAEQQMSGFGRKAEDVGKIRG